jgi:hypothetical protein
MREMESQIATYEDAKLVLKLYDLRREAVLRKARHFVAFEFKPATADEFFAIAQGPDTEQGAYFRQVISYWEMAASLVLHGAVKADLYFPSNGEGLFIFAKFHAFREEYQARTGRPFMRQTAQLVEKFSTAKEMFNTIVKSIQARTS